MAENNLDGVGRRLRAPGSQHANAEELLAELVRLIEFSGLAPKRSQPAETVSEPKRADTKPMRRLEMTSPRPSVEAPSSKPSETGAVDAEPPGAPESDNSSSNDRRGTDLATGRRARAWTFKVSALVLAGAALIGSIFWLKRVEPGLPSAPPFIATGQRPTTMQPRSNLTDATPSDAGATLSDITQPAQGKVVSAEERPIDLNASFLLNNPPPSADLALTAIGGAQPTADASAGQPLAAVNTPAVAAPIAASPLVASQSPESKPAPAVSLPPNPTQIATPTPSATDSGVAAPSSDAPMPPVRPASKAATEAAGVERRSTSKLDLPTKLSSKSAAHVVVAKAEATGPGAPAETRSEPPQRGASVKPEKEAKTLQAAQALAEAQRAPSAQSVATPRPNPNPVVRTFSYMVGAVTGFIPFVPH